MNEKIKILDSTLRDGVQGEGIAYSVEDKIGIVIALDSLGVTYIEAGNPGSNPKDMEFFKRVSQLNLKHSKLAAFCSTRRKNSTVTQDSSIAAAMEANTNVIVVFGKSWDFHASEIIGATLEENLDMITDTVAYFKGQGKEVIYDAEHFFDGFKGNRAYAAQTLAAAKEGGADCVVLCDTNGGTLPGEIKEITQEVISWIEIPVGIHCHDDAGCAVANSLTAIDVGVTHVQGTFLGFGERCGNANLSTIIANLQLKMKLNCIPDSSISKLSLVARYIADITNITLASNMPYVGNSAFAHKGGMHTDGVLKATRSFEHIDPNIVGNYRRFLASEVAGRAAILHKVQHIEASIQKDNPVLSVILEKLKDLEFGGWLFESAEASLELLMRKLIGKYQPFFELIHFKIMGEQPYVDGLSALAAIKVRVDNKVEMTAAEGNGPIHAIDKALRKSLEIFYPSLLKVHLIDYKVRVLDPQGATASKVRVLITSTDGKDTWSTVGVSCDIIEASWLALADSIDYKLTKDLEDGNIEKVTF